MQIYGSICSASSVTFILLLAYPKQEESSAWAKRVIDVASITEDADSITEMHQAVFEKQMFAVDSPDGEHDLEDVVSIVLCPLTWNLEYILCFVLL